jgi:hypothetical protein
MSKIEQRVRLILSTGRVGSSYLYMAFNDAGRDMVTLQEPLPSRYFYLIANASNRILNNSSFVLRCYERGLRKRVSRIGNETYIETNPYLCPIAEKLHLIAEDLHVVHIVRDPRTWVQSQLDFGGQGYNRHLAKWTPFNMPGSTRDYRAYGAGKISKVQQAIWRWSDFNRRIESLDGKIAGFHRVRFEDLFSTDEQTVRMNLKLILKAFDLEEKIAVGDLMNRPAANKSHKGIAYAYSQWTEADIRYLEKAAGQLMTKYGYGDPVRI